MKLANRQAGQLTSQALIRTGCSTGHLALRGCRLPPAPHQQHAMNNDESQIDSPGANRRRRHHLRVPVLPEEKEQIEANAAAAGLSVARYLREVGQGHRPQSVQDYRYVRELAKVNGDLGRLGGLLKLWLTDDDRVAHFGEGTIRTLLERIEDKQEQMGVVMQKMVRPRAGGETP